MNVTFKIIITKVIIITSNFNMKESAGEGG